VGLFRIIWQSASFTGTKFGGGGKARAGKNSFPSTPFLFARPSDWISKFAVRFAENQPELANSV